MKLLRLIRFPNLLVVALTQYLVALHVLGRSFESENIASILNHTELFLLVAATVCLTAAGYIINDLLDAEIDKVNKPDKVIIGVKMAEHTAAWLTFAFVMVGFIAALTLAFYKGELKWLWLYPVFTVLLGVYPRYLKVRPFAGNLLIASCCAGTAGLVWLAERASWQNLSVEQRGHAALILILFMWYAFVATWIREIIKDMEDVRGDYEQGCKTLPIAFGLSKAKNVVYLLSSLLVLALLSTGLLSYHYFGEIRVMWCSFILIACIIWMNIRLKGASNDSDFHFLSQAWKFFMLGGLLLLFLYQL